MFETNVSARVGIWEPRKGYAIEREGRKVREFYDLGCVSVGHCHISETRTRRDSSLFTVVHPYSIKHCSATPSLSSRNNAFGSASRFCGLGFVSARDNKD